MCYPIPSVRQAHNQVVTTESETSTEGIITVYGYNELKQKVIETKKGFAVNGADDIITLYAYDLENRILFSVVTNSASGLGYMASRSAYDAVGRATNMVDRLGNATFTDYDTLVTTVLRPNGVTAVTERYLDGRSKRVLENGVVKNAYAYGVNPDGASWTLSARGPLPAAIQLTLELPNFSMLELLDFPWLLQATDPLGRNIATYKPGFGGTVLVSSNAYDIAGSLLFTTQYSSQLLNLNSSILNAPTLYSYAADGSLFLTALDLNTNGVIDLSGPDRITGSSAVYDKDTSNVWWLVSRSWVYPEFGSSASVTTSVERVMLTGLSAARGDGYVLTALSRSLDVRGNATTSCTFIDRTARRVTHATTSPVSVQSAIQFSVNGLEVSNISATAVATAYAYDALGRRTLSETVSGERRVALLTQYNSHGQIEYTEDAASNRTSYAYDALGRRTAVIDALSNTVYTAYDTDDHVIALWGATYPVSYGYDTLGNMVEMGTYRGTTEITDYAGFLSLVSKFDKTSWLYEQPTGLLTNKLFVDDAGPTYTYTTDGKLASRKWARNIETSYTYDNTGAMVKIDYSDTTPDINYTNDRLGNICFVSDDDSGSHTLSHDPDGLLLMDVVQFKNKVFSFCEFYDVFGRSAGYTISNSVDNVSSFITGTVLNYGSLGRIREIAVQGKSIPFRYSWLPGSDLQATLTMPNGVTRETVFEPYRDLPSSITHTNAEGTILVQRLLTYDEIGHLKNRIQFRACEAVNRFDSFTYNDRSELTHASLGTNAFSYAFDCIGNRQSAAEPQLTANYFSNSLNQYTNIAYGNAPLFTPLYDADGNQTLIQTATGIWHVTYNAENRPVVFSNETTVVEMSYDYLGRRCEYKEKIEGMLIRHERYLYRDRVQVAAIDLLDATSPQSRLIYGLIWDPTDPVATHPLASIEPSSMNSENMIWHYYNIDQVKNVTEIFDDSSDVALTYDYTPFGIVISNMYAHVDINTPPVAFNPLTFASEVQDATIGLQYFNFRHYNPFDGRWINRDPLEDVAFYARRNLKFYETMALSRSRNKGEMLYCDNEVMSSVDYLGLSCDKGCSKTDFTTSLSWGETIPGIGISVKIQGSRTTQESTCGIECKDCSCGKEIKKKDSWTFGEAFSVPVRVYGVRIGEIGVDGGGTGFTEDNYNSCTGLRTSDKVLGIYINVSGGPCVFVSSYAKWCVKCSLAYKYQYSSYTSRSYSGWSGGCYFESCLGPVCKKVPLGKGHTR